MTFETPATCAAARTLLRTSDLNWLLHRAARRLGEALDSVAQQHGVGIRGQLVLTALIEEPGRTQLALGAALGLDKTTLTSTLDKLEQAELVVRRPDPQDRRVRIPEVTEKGRVLRERVAHAVWAVEQELLRVLDEEQQGALCKALRQLADAELDGVPPPGGSCL